MARHQFSQIVIGTGSTPAISGAMTGNITSNYSNIANIDDVSVQLDFTSGATGTFAFQVSDNYIPGSGVQSAPANAGTWTTVPVLDSSGLSPSVAGSAGTLFLNIMQINATWCRVIYNFTSGSGTLTAVITGKAAG